MKWRSIAYGTLEDSAIEQLGGAFVSWAAEARECAFIHVIGRGG